MILILYLKLEFGTSTMCNLRHCEEAGNNVTRKKKGFSRLTVEYPQSGPRACAISEVQRALHLIASITKRPHSHDLPKAYNRSEALTR